MLGRTLFTTLLGSMAIMTARADVPVPTAPGPGDKFQIGGQCTIQWTADTTNTWKQMYIELMTGDNFNMVHLTTVGQFDGTDSSNTSYSWPCPNVTPHSAIYFYQFSSPVSTSPSWTTRFTIAGSDGSSVAPEHTTQPNGGKIAWGVGAFVDPTQATAAPYNSPKGSNLSGAPPASASSVSASASSASASAPASPSSSVPQAASRNVAPSGMTTLKSSSTAAPSSTASGSAGTISPKLKGVSAALGVIAVAFSLL